MNHFRLPYRLVVEEGLFEHIPEAMADVMPGIEKMKTLIVTEKNLSELFSGIIGEMQKDFSGAEVYLIQGASYDNAAALAKYILTNSFKIVIGFGGDTVLDIAKFAAYVSKATLISLATTLSNDSLTSPVAVLGTEGRQRKTFGCTIPDAILVDTNLILSAPERQLLGGIGDTVSKYTALNDWKLAYRRGKDKVDDFAYMISKMAFNSINYSRDFIKRLTQALVMGGLAMEIAGTSRPSSGSEHLFCHALEEIYYDQVNVPHGIAVAMGSYPAVIFQERNVKKITKLIQKYKIPVRPSEWKITKEIFIGAWQQAASTRADRYTILNETDLSGERLGKIYDDMEEIFKYE